MNVLHVVSGLAPDQRFGGISRVALDLAREQQLRGHRVHILSTDIGFARPVPTRIDGVRVTLLRSLHLVPHLGFGTIASPMLVAALVRLLRQADVVHVHLAREFNTLVAAIVAVRLGQPLVLQTHGMLDAPNNAVARVVDVMLTAPLLRTRPVTLTLTDEEDEEVSRLSGGTVRATRFSNGVDLEQFDGAEPPGVRGTVLFLARLHPRKGAVPFAEAAIRIAADLRGWCFALVGPDEGDGARVRALIESAGTADVVYRGAVTHDSVRDHMAEAALYCLPAEHEPFGLAVLEALASGTPVLLHETAVLAPEVVAAGAGWTFGDGEAGPSLEEAIRAALLDPSELRRRGARGRDLGRRYGLAAVVTRLDEVYETL